MCHVGSKNFVATDPTHAGLCVAFHDATMLNRPHDEYHPFSYPRGDVDLQQVILQQ